MSKLLTETAVANLDGENSKFCTVLMHGHTAIKTHIIIIYVHALYVYVQSDAYYKIYCFFSAIGIG